jgi:hypothetical protein
LCFGLQTKVSFTNVNFVGRPRDDRGCADIALTKHTMPAAKKKAPAKKPAAKKPAAKKPAAKAAPKAAPKAKDLKAKKSVKAGGLLLPAVQKVR